MAAFDKILFNRPNGTIFKQKLFDAFGQDASSNREATIQAAGVMTVAYIPVIGDCDYDARYGIGSPSKVSPFNADLSTLYVKLKGKAMTLGNYSAADVGKGMLALDSLYGLLAELDVDINSLSQYCFNNVAERGMIQNILWRDPAKAQANIANLIKRRNNIAAKMEMLPFVPGIKFMQDHIDWARYIYKDDNLDKSALILFRRSGYYRWCCRTTDTFPGTLRLSDNTTGAVYTRLDYGIIKAEDKFDILEMLLNDYALDDDFTELCAGIANAYGIDTNSYHIPTLPDDITKFKLEFKYDLDVIDSLRSADFSYLSRSMGNIVGIDETVEGHLAYTSDFSNKPDGKFRIPALTVISGTNPEQFKCIDTGDSRVIYSYEDNPSSEAIDVLVRYVHDYVHNSATDNYSTVYGLKSEFLTGLAIYYLDDDRSFTAVNLDCFVTVGVPNTTPFSTDRGECVASSLISLPQLYHIVTDGNFWFMGAPIRKSKKDIDNIGYLPRYANSTCAEAYMWNKFFTSSSIKRRTNRTNKPNPKDEEPKE
jgi:hypothetical protein